MAQEARRCNCRAMDWAIEHRQAYNIRIINMLGTTRAATSTRRSVMRGDGAHAGIASWWAAQLASDGNMWAGITSPATPNGLSVDTRRTPEAVRRHRGNVLEGPTRYDLILKPDVVAPCAHRIGGSGQPSVSRQDLSRPSRISMAAGVVSGAAALILDGGTLAPRNLPDPLANHEQLPSAAYSAVGPESSIWLRQWN